jgi:hypothetical protein
MPWPGAALPPVVTTVHGTALPRLCRMVQFLRDLETVLGTRTERRPYLCPRAS